jgi:hypothetical protein
MKRETGYYWVKPKSTVNAHGTGTPNAWGIYYYMSGNDNLAGSWLGLFDGQGDKWIDEINETRLIPPIDPTPEQIEQERIQKGRADYGVYS